MPPWFKYEGVDIIKIDDTAYTYKTGYISLDADGSPRAYHPQNKGLDNNKNAGYPNKGWKSVLAVDPDDPSKPFVQTAGEFAGYFVSKTSLRDPKGSIPETDPNKYVNSETIPYLVFPGEFHSLPGTGTWGDLAMVRSLVGKTRETAAIVADGGPSKAPLGEMSLALAVAMGGVKPNPRTGKGSPKGPIQYMIFPKSRLTPVWPHTFAEIQAKAQALLQSVGGWPDI